MGKRKTAEEKMQALAQRMEKLQEERAELENQRKVLQKEIDEKERKARTKRLIEIGAGVESALGYSLDSPEARKAFCDFIKSQEARGKWVTKAIEQAVPAAPEVPATVPETSAEEVPDNRADIMNHVYNQLHNGLQE